MTYTRWSTIGQEQPNGVQEKVLPGNYFGFTVGLGSSGSVEAMCNAWDAFTGGNTESVGWGLPNSMGTPNLSPLAGITRFVVFAAPLIPHNVSGSSITKLLRGDYDAQIDANANAVIALGLGKKCAVRWGWEFNGGAGSSLTAGFEWATNHSDPLTGVANGISQVHLGQAYVEGRWRSAGYTGYAAWSGGTHDTSALSIANAIPTHGDPSLTCWDWDLYPPVPYNGTKNDIAAIIAKIEPIYDGYLSYIRTHGLVGMGHSEYGMVGNPASPYTPNDNDIWFPWWYGKLRANSRWVLWANAYWQNQDYVSPGGTNAPLKENHQIAFSVPTSGGSPQGAASTAAWTGNYPPGQSGPNVSGTANTVANNGSLQNSSDLGTHWVWSTDPSKAKARTSWQATFGGVGEAAGLGAAGLRIPITAPVIATGSSPTVPGRKIRRQYVAFR